MEVGSSQIEAQFQEIFRPVNQSQFDPSSEKAISIVFWDIGAVILINCLLPS
jgi:hypothetical protein